MSQDAAIEPDTKDWTWVLEAPCGECGFEATALDRHDIAPRIRADVAIWQAVLSLHARPGPALLALLATIVQMGMLGALLTFATRPLYAAHATTTIPFGLSPLEDQQLAGLILWVPAALPYLVAMILIVLRLQPVADGARAQPVTGG